MDKIGLFQNLRNEIPIEHISFDEHLLEELKSLDIIKRKKKCVYFLKINNELENILRNRIKRDVKEAYFQYGQLLFYDKRYVDAAHYFNEGVVKHIDLQCMFQLGVIYYEGLGCEEDPELGCGYMKNILEARNLPEAKHLIFAAAFNLGRAYYSGFGVPQSDKKAAYWFYFASDEGSRFGSAFAQSMLGYYYCTPGHFDLNKSFYWHSEACGNGSLHSQGVLGVMHFLGLGTPVNLEAALICLREASTRGDVYAQGMLCYYYFSTHLYRMAANLSAEIITMSQNKDQDESDSYRKGVAIAIFIYGRCLNFGYGVKKNRCLAQLLNKESYLWNADITVHFRSLVGLGEL